MYTKNLLLNPNHNVPLMLCNPVAPLGRLPARSSICALPSPSTLLSENLMKSQLMLQQAWASIAALENYPQMSIECIFNQIAYATVLIDQQTGIDLSEDFADGLSAQVVELFNAALAKMKQGSATTGKARSSV